MGRAFGHDSKEELLYLVVKEPIAQMFRTTSDDAPERSRVQRDPQIPVATGARPTSKQAEISAPSR
jgi:hypothetical protein